MTCSNSPYLFNKELQQQLSLFFKKDGPFAFFLYLKKKKKNITSKTELKEKIPLSSIIDFLKLQKGDLGLKELFNSRFKLYQKKNFDVFCRGERKYICRTTRRIFDEKGKNNHRVETTLAQLNFFKFLYTENILKKIKEEQQKGLLKKKNTTPEQGTIFDFSLKEFQPVEIDKF